MATAGWLRYCCTFKVASFAVLIVVTSGIVSAGINLRAALQLQAGNNTDQTDALQTEGLSAAADRPAVRVNAAAGSKSVVNAGAGIRNSRASRKARDEFGNNNDASSVPHSQAVAAAGARGAGGNGGKADLYKSSRDVWNDMDFGANMGFTVGSGSAGVAAAQQLGSAAVPMDFGGVHATAGNPDGFEGSSSPAVAGGNRNSMYADFGNMDILARVSRTQFAALDAPVRGGEGGDGIQIGNSAGEDRPRVSPDAGALATFEGAGIISPSVMGYPSSIADVRKLDSQAEWFQQQFGSDTAEAGAARRPAVGHSTIGGGAGGPRPASLSVPSAAGVFVRTQMSPASPMHIASVLGSTRNGSSRARARFYAQQQQALQQQALTGANGANQHQVAGGVSNSNVTQPGIGLPAPSPTSIAFGQIGLGLGMTPTADSVTGLGLTPSMYSHVTRATIGGGGGGKQASSGMTHGLASSLAAAAASAGAAAAAAAASHGIGGASMLSSGLGGGTAVSVGAATAGAGGGWGSDGYSPLGHHMMMHRHAVAMQAQQLQQHQQLQLQEGDGIDHITPSAGRAGLAAAAAALGISPAASAMHTGSGMGGPAGGGGAGGAARLAGGNVRRGSNQHTMMMIAGPGFGASASSSAANGGGGNGDDDDMDDGGGLNLQPPGSGLGLGPMDPHRRLPSQRISKRKRAGSDAGEDAGAGSGSTGNAMLMMSPSRYYTRGGNRGQPNMGRANNSNINSNIEGGDIIELGGPATSRTGTSDAAASDEGSVPSNGALHHHQHHQYVHHGGARIQAGGALVPSSGDHASTGSKSSSGNSNTSGGARGYLDPASSSALMPNSVGAGHGGMHGRRGHPSTTTAASSSLHGPSVAASSTSSNGRPALPGTAAAGSASSMGVAEALAALQAMQESGLLVDQSTARAVLAAVGSPIHTQLAHGGNNYDGNGDEEGEVVDIIQPLSASSSSASSSSGRGRRGGRGGGRGGRGRGGAAGRGGRGACVTAAHGATAAASTDASAPSSLPAISNPVLTLLTQAVERLTPRSKRFKLDEVIARAAAGGFDISGFLESHNGGALSQGLPTTATTSAASLSPSGDAGSEFSIYPASQLHHGGQGQGRARAGSSSSSASGARPGSVGAGAGRQAAASARKAPIAVAAPSVVPGSWLPASMLSSSAGGGSGGGHASSSLSSSASTSGLGPSASGGGFYPTGGSAAVTAMSSGNNGSGINVNGGALGSLGFLDGLLDQTNKNKAGGRSFKGVMALIEEGELLCAPGNPLGLAVDHGGAVMKRIGAYYITVPLEPSDHQLAQGEGGDGADANSNSNSTSANGNNNTDIALWCGTRWRRMLLWATKRVARNWSKEAMVRYPHRADVVARRIREQGRFS